MILRQVIELSNGNYQIEADIGEQEAMYLFGVAFSNLLMAGSKSFIEEILGEKGSLTTLQSTPSKIQ